MTNEICPDEAAGALIARRRAQVVTLTIVPTWFWWAIAVLMVAVAVETRRPLVTGMRQPCSLSAFSSRRADLLGVVGRAQPRHALFAHAGVLAVLGFVAGILAVSLPTSFLNPPVVLAGWSCRGRADAL